MPNPYLPPNTRPDPAIIDEYATIGVGELDVPHYACDFYVDAFIQDS